MTSMGELDLLREDLRRASKHLKEATEWATEWARAHPDAPDSAVRYLLANVDGVIEAMNAASSLIWSLQNEAAIEAIREAMDKERSE